MIWDLAKSENIYARPSPGVGFSSLLSHHDKFRVTKNTQSTCCYDDCQKHPPLFGIFISIGIGRIS